MVARSTEHQFLCTTHLLSSEDLWKERNMVSNEWLLSSKILIVDDDEGILDLCKTILRNAGYRNIKTTTDPRGVLAHFVEYDSDILILDIMMPHLDGLQLLQLLQRSAKDGISIPI